MSRDFVLTKTPTQVASHSQKYYIRQKLSGENENKRRQKMDGAEKENKSFLETREQKHAKSATGMDK